MTFWFCASLSLIFEGFVQRVLFCLVCLLVEYWPSQSLPDAGWASGNGPQTARRACCPDGCQYKDEYPGGWSQWRATWKQSSILLVGLEKLHFFFFQFSIFLIFINLKEDMCSRVSFTSILLSGFEHFSTCFWVFFLCFEFVPVACFFWTTFYWFLQLFVCYWNYILS